MEAQSSGETVTRYIHGPRGIHTQQTDSEWRWMLQDGLNSVRSVVDNDIAVQQSVVYDPYGNPIGLSGAEQTMYGYTGEPVDSNGLVYLRNRYYNPNMGTFISQDPYEGSMNNPMSLNRYAYVQGNPVNTTDPSGMMPLSPMNNLMQSNPLAFAKMMNSGTCYQAQPADCNFIQRLFGLCPTSTPTSTPSATPMPTATPTDSPTVNPCATRTIFPVFGSCGENCTPHIAGSGYTDTHRALDLVPQGAYENYPTSIYLAPDWSTRAGTEDYSTIYAIADGTVYTYAEAKDSIVLRLSDTWEFVYVHIKPFVTSGYVTAGTPLGMIIPHTEASVSAAEGFESDQDHLHFGLRQPSRIAQTLDSASCLQGLIGG